MPIRIILVLLFAGFHATSQTVKYVNPLSIPLRLSGNFCEVRTDHFHSGIDIKTAGQVGLPVFAVDDGYVSRVKFSAAGYGKAIYVTHPDYCVTVYGHLHALIGALADSIESLQYQKESFELEWFPEKNYFPVKKGQQIAWSGNSGGSESPHLHFEIRDEVTEEPLNPLLNGWSIQDTVAPELVKVAIYKYSNGRFLFYNDFSFIDEANESTSLDTIYINSDTAALSFVVTDNMNDSLTSELGIYSMLLMNGVDTLYHYSFDRMNFSETRNVNGYIDYSQKEIQKAIFFRCFPLPGNKFETFRNAGKGLILIHPGEIAELKVIVTDANKNLTGKNIYVKNISTILSVGEGMTDSYYYPNGKILREWPDAAVTIPEEAFFETEPIISFDRKYDHKNKLPLLQIGSKEIALKKAFILSFKPAEKYKAQKTKLVVVELSDKGKFIRSIGGIYKNGILKATSLKFGKFSFAVDTVAPIIQDVKIETDTIFQQQWLRLIVKDALSGIKRYTVKVNGNWKLFEYDPKSNSLTYQLRKEDDRLDLYVELEDNCGNTRVFRKLVENKLEDFIKK